MFKGASNLQKNNSMSVKVKSRLYMYKVDLKQL